MTEGLSILMPVYDEVGTVEAAIEDALSAELPVAARDEQKLEELLEKYRGDFS